MMRVFNASFDCLNACGVKSWSRESRDFKPRVLRAFGDCCQHINQYFDVLRLTPRWRMFIAINNGWDIYSFLIPDIVEAEDAPDLSKYLDFISRDTRVCARVTWAKNAFLSGPIEKFQTNPFLQDAVFRDSSPCPVGSGFSSEAPHEQNAFNSPTGTIAWFGSASHWISSR